MSGTGAKPWRCSQSFHPAQTTESHNYHTQNNGCEFLQFKILKIN
jgi:hypothetical protein